MLVVALLACSDASLREDNARLTEVAAEAERRAEQAEARVVMLEAELAEARAAAEVLTDLQEASVRAYEPPLARCTGEGQDRTVSDARNPFAAPESVLADARLVPDGHGGIRVFGVRRGSLLDSCGVSNGDVLLSLNGLPVGSLEAWAAATPALEASETVDIELRRRGAPVHLLIRTSP